MAHTLPGELDFANILAALERARAELASGSGPLELDLSGVTRADSSGLALLLELSRMARARKRELRITRAPAQLRRLAEFFGLNGLLPLNH